MTHSIIIQHTIDKHLAPSSIQLRKWAKTALKHASKPQEVTIRLVDREEITQLNLTYRHKNDATNVLSFPIQIPEAVKFSKTPLGDVVICADVVNQEAQEQSKSIDAHWAHMVIHGIFHLMGHDHQLEEEALRMEALEIETLKQLGFANPYETRDKPL